VHNAGAWVYHLFIDIIFYTGKYYLLPESVCVHNAGAWVYHLAVNNIFLCKK